LNAVFIHIPRTAGRYIARRLSLERLIYPHRARKLFRQEGRVTFGHQNYLRLIERGLVSRKFSNDAFIFTFVRNPFVRAVSHYHHAKLKGEQIVPQVSSFIEFTRRIDSYYRFLKPKQRGYRGKKAFSPQVESIRNVPVSFVGRYERLETDLEILSRIFGTPLQKVDAIGSTKHGPFEEYYNKESEENIRKYYAEDFERFGYDDHLLHG